MTVDDLHKLALGPNDVLLVRLPEDAPPMATTHLRHAYSSAQLVHPKLASIPLVIVTGEADFYALEEAEQRRMYDVLRGKFEGQS